MKITTKTRLVVITCCVVAMAIVPQQNLFAQNLSYYQCAEVNGTDHANNLLHVRMAGLHASITAVNSGTSAKTFTVVLKNVDPDFVFLSEGNTTARGVNTLTFSWTIAAGATRTVWINPWYLTPWDFYFVAWGDSQHQPQSFQKALTKIGRINPVLSVAAGDCIKHGDDGGCVGSGNQPEYATDQMYLNYLQLFNNHPTPVFEALGNHDITRGGWSTMDDSRYGAGERLWRKYLGPTEYSFTVHPTYAGGGIHFLINRFYYDMPNWNKRVYFGGCIPDGFLRFDNNDSVGVAISNFTENSLAANQNAAARISVTHHGFNMFAGDHNTVAHARALYQNGNVDYMVVGHRHTYSTGVDGPTQIPYLITGDANYANPGFSLVHVQNGQITQQHMLADNLNLNINYTADGPSLTQGTATITCSGYSLPFVRLKFKLSTAHENYQAKDVATGATIPTYCRRFEDYTVVYVETSIGNGATKNIQVDPLTTSAARLAEEQINLYPNTAKNRVTISLPTGTNETYQVRLFDMQGRMLREVRSSAATVSIPLNGLAQGPYVVKISAGNKHIAVKRLIVEK
jgi:hypothetical protein